MMQSSCSDAVQNRMLFNCSASLSSLFSIKYVFLLFEEYRVYSSINMNTGLWLFNMCLSSLSVGVKCCSIHTRMCEGGDCRSLHPLRILHYGHGLDASDPNGEYREEKQSSWRGIPESRECSSWCLRCVIVELYYVSTLLYHHPRLRIRMNCELTSCPSFFLKLCLHNPLSVGSSAHTIDALAYVFVKWVFCRIGEAWAMDDQNPDYNT